MKNPPVKPARGASLSPGWRQRMYDIIFETHTPAGRAFDLILLALILASVLVTVLDSVASVRESSGRLLFIMEWGFTILFAAEYFMRLACSPEPRKYALSFLGVVDLIGWLPTVAGLIIPGTQYLTTFRIIRVLRIFRILKMAAYLEEARYLVAALKSGMKKIVVFLFAVLTLVVLLGSLMYLVEGPENGFVSIPVSIYWAVVTLTTVGYGDISPATSLGQMLASLVMILGYSIIAVPTGIVSAEFIRGGEKKRSTACPGCGTADHEPDARYCRRCGAALKLRRKSS
ncbi:MAG TPA: ion transporter [bacterium]|nr:ion transporter [bacterium]